MKLPKYMQKNAGPITVVERDDMVYYVFTDDEGEHWHKKHPDGPYDPSIPVTCDVCNDAFIKQFGEIL